MLDDKGGDAAYGGGNSKTNTRLDDNTTFDGSDQSQNLLSNNHRTDHEQIPYADQSAQPARKDGVRKKLATASFSTRQKLGVGDDEDEINDPQIMDKIADATPGTKRRIIKEETTKKQAKLGVCATMFTIFKGFVCTGILYIPGDFIIGGYGWSAITVLFCLLLTLYCSTLLIEVYEKVGGSLPEIGMKTYGKPGKILVDVSLFSSQFGFVTAYIYFITSQIAGEGGIIQCITSNSDDQDSCEGGTLINRWWFLLVCCAIYIPLVYVRKIEVFAPTHIFADFMIIITIVVISVYAGIEIHDNGGIQTAGVQFINPTLWFDAIGFSVYCFEGIGVILPIMEVTERKDIYLKVLIFTVGFIGIFYCAFAEFWLFAFGANNLTTPLITDQLPPRSWVTYFVKLAFSLNLIFTYPLVIHPANLVLESYLFGTWPKSRKRQMCKNLTRAILVAASCALALVMWNNLTKFLSITGALTCTPIAFILPALFHYKACAETKCQRVVDLTIVVSMTITGIFCTFMAIFTFND